MIKCPKCGSCDCHIYRHPNSSIECNVCGFVIRNEGTSEFNIYKAKGDRDCLVCKFTSNCTLKYERGFKPCQQYAKYKEKKFD